MSPRGGGGSTTSPTASPPQLRCNNSSSFVTYERFGNIEEHETDNYAGISPCNSDKRRLSRGGSTNSESSDTNALANAPTTCAPVENHNRRARACSSKSDHNYRYEEFSSKLTLQCPTCNGKGKLTQGQADSMVALIPVRDKRLKPRKTKLYLGVTFFLCMLITFLVTFFMLPRSVTLEIVDTQTKNIYMPKDFTDKTTPYIDVAVTFKIKNDNFFKAVISDIDQDISWNRFLLNSSVISGNKMFHVTGRTEKNHTILTRQIFQGDVNCKVKRVCTFGWKWSLLEMFVNTATVSYLYRTEQISDTNYEYVTCYNQTSSDNVDMFGVGKGAGGNACGGRHYVT